MRAGECYPPPCGTPLELDNLLVNLFAKDAAGCVGLKIYAVNVFQPEDANICTTELTLQQLLTNSLVDDGNGFPALRMVYVSGDMNCLPCAMSQDVDSLLRSLFVKMGNCFGIKVAAAAASCSSVEPYSRCLTRITSEQLIKSAVVSNATYGNYLLINQLIENCAEKLPCDLHQTFEQLLLGLFVQVTGECYGALNLNLLLTPDEDLKQCGEFLTLEEAVKSAITVTDCGYALNVFLVGGAQ